MADWIISGQWYDSKRRNADQDLGKCRLKSYYKDLQNLITWLSHQSHNPFDSNRTNLQVLDSGLIADQLIICDDAEDIGRIIQQKLDNVALGDASIKRLQQAITFASLKPSVKVCSQTAVIDPMVLFSCLVVLVQRTNDISSYFAYGPAPLPYSLHQLPYSRII